MSGATTELSLATAVDSDDNADYLTLSLANSLRTVDGLFNAVTGHTHNGAHQGAPVPASTIANGSVTNAMLGPDVARANQLTNGGFEIWQRGNGPFTASGVFNADRWSMSLNGSDTCSITKNTATVDGGSAAAAAVTYTLVTGGSGFYQTFVMTDFPQLRGKTLTFSMRVRASTTATGAVSASGDIGGLVASGNHSGNATFQTLSATFTVNANATSFQVGFWPTKSTTLYFDNAMLVVGSQPADYSPLHPADDLERCQRYYEIIGETPSSILLTASNGGAGNVAMNLPYKQRKPITPTATKNGTWTATNCGQPAASLAGLDLISIYTAVTSSGSYQLQNSGAGSNFSLEANP